MPSGAFVARRNGKVFVTGNSGFPKSKGCLKPGYEPIVLARNPDKKVLPLQIDRCRIGTERDVPGGKTSNARAIYPGFKSGRDEAAAHDTQIGRWPANVILDEAAAAQLDAMSGKRPGDRLNRKSRKASGFGANFMDDNWKPAGPTETNGFTDFGGASRFFYCPKASRRDRNEGLEGMPEHAALRDGARFNSGGRTLIEGEWIETGSETRPKANRHPTVKPTPLMRWLCRLITPPGGIVLDPFAGSGSTGKAAVLEGFSFLGIEREAEYVAIARRRIDTAMAAIAIPA